MSESSADAEAMVSSASKVLVLKLGKHSIEASHVDGLEIEFAQERLADVILRFPIVDHAADAGADGFNLVPVRQQAGLVHDSSVAWDNSIWIQLQDSVQRGGP